ncbi:hypothetical protein HPB51_029584 [Rhipicephalus microplus]|uniref:Uncharacterized protein n=1 Tax=Rhipicephalus microplus TaxID=6941 RepID=A0A9J6CTV6_RHIMP|nr:hypothetical protein HPB51_029584 [Rhipicephalus microplus]
METRSGRTIGDLSTGSTAGTSSTQPSSVQATTYVTLPPLRDPGTFSGGEDSQCQNNELLPVTPAQRVSVNVNTVQSNTKKSSIEPVPRLPASTTSLAVTQPEPTNACAQNKTEPQNLTLPANQSVRELSVLENLPPPNLSEIANVRKPVDVNNQEPSNLAEHAQLPEPEKLFEATKTQTSHNTPARNPDLELRAPAKLLVLAKPEVSADVPLAKRQEPAHDSAPAKRVAPVKIQPPVSLVASANLPKPRKEPTPSLSAPDKRQAYIRLAEPENMPKPGNMLAANIKTPAKLQARVLETLAKPTSNHPVPTDNTSTVNLLSSKKVQETRSVQPLNISESGITPATAHAIMTINLSKSSSLPEPTNRLPHNFPAPTDLLASEKLPAFMNTPVLSIPEPINVSAAPANLPKSENMRAANIKPRSNHQIYIRLRKPKLHKPANTPTPIIPTSPSVEALNITETRTLMEPREFLTTAKLPMSVDMKAPNVSSHSRVKVSKNLPAKVPVQASVSANLPTQNLTKPGNHLVPTEMPKPTNLSAPNHPLGINIPTSKSPLVPEELLASTNVQENLRAANIKPRSNRPIYISLRKPSALSNLPAHKNFPALAEVLAEVNLVAPLTGIPLLSSAGQANRSVSVNPPTSSQQPQMNTLASKSLVELASMPRHEHFLAPNFPNTMSQPLNLYVPESPAKPTDQPATRLQVTTNLPEPASIPIGQLASLASDLDAPVREQQSPNLDTFYDPYTYEVGPKLPK